jgi:hypothetical protein
MSLLGSQVYANPTTPLWGSGGGGGGSNATFSNVTVTSNVVVGGAVEVPFLNLTDLSGNAGVGSLQSLAVSDGDSADGFILQGELLRFGKQATKNANTTFVPSVFGANTDNFSVGGTMNCLIGPVPTQLITSTKNISNVSVSPSGPDAFPVDVSLSSISNAEYDVQMTGTVYVASGAIDASDYVVMNLVTSGGSGTLGAIVFPSERLLGANFVSGIGPLVASGAAANVNLRSRITATASGTTLGANVRAFSPNASTAVYGANLTFLDVQRVR